MIKSDIINFDEDKDSFDKMQIALTIRNATYEGGLECILLDDEIVKDCSGCNIKPICEGLERLAEEYLSSTTRIVSSFNFQ